MDEHDGLEQLGLPFDEQNATLTAIFNNGVEDALASLSPAQLLQLEKNVRRLKNTHKSSSTSARGKDHFHQSVNIQSGIASVRSNIIPNSLNGNLRGLDSVDNVVCGYQDLHGHEQDPHMHDMMAAADVAEDQRHSSRSSSVGHHTHHSTNLPASCPVLEIRDGLEYLIFTYSTKGQLQEFSIKTEIDHLTLEEIPDDFKAENCVYPRAFCARDQYIGNRWEYETACNELAWKLTWLNSEILSAKRGLIQRAVDSYRNRLTDMRSRRVVRQEKLTNGTLRRRTTEISSSSTPHSIIGHRHHHLLDGSSNSPYPLNASNGGGAGSERHQKMKQITVPYTTKGAVAKMRIRVDVENVNEAEVDEMFRRENSIYPDGDASDAIGARRDYEMESNELAWKLAWLNPAKLAGKKTLLQKAVDCYRTYTDQQLSSVGRGGGRKGGGVGRHNSLSHLDHHMGNEYLQNDYHAFEMQKQEEFSEIVANTLQQALSHHDLAGHDLTSVVGDLDELGGGGADGSGDHDVYRSFHSHMYDPNASAFYH